MAINIYHSVSKCPSFLHFKKCVWYLSSFWCLTPLAKPSLEYCKRRTFLDLVTSTVTSFLSVQMSCPCRCCGWVLCSDLQNMSFTGFWDSHLRHGTSVCQWFKENVWGKFEALSWISNVEVCSISSVLFSVLSPAGLHCKPVHWKILWGMIV